MPPSLLGAISPPPFPVQMQGVRVRPKAKLSGAVHGGRRDEAAAEGGGV
jgi:hypothetical protein